MNAIIHASELITGSGIRKKDGRRPTAQDMDRIPDGAIVYDQKNIHWVGPTKELPKKYLKSKRKNLKNEKCVTPGFVDCHTHLIHAGSRAQEFAARCQGATYEEIAKKGGGIQTTVRATREASVEELFKTAKKRIAEAIRHGVTCIESKSGYGLSHEAEIKTLQVTQKLKKAFPELYFQSTYLGAHDFPKDRSREDYLDEICEETLPEVAKKKLADACDVFIDQDYYTVEEGRRILEKAKKLGLKIKVHADELHNTEATQLAVQLQALSADHLLKISDASVAAIAKSQTVAVLLPGTAFYLKAPYAPARKLIDAGACVALSSDFNPGSCNSFSLPLMMTLSALYMGMSEAEIFAGVTYNAAKALGIQSFAGTLEPGMKPYLSIFEYLTFEEVYHHLGW